MSFDYGPLRDGKRDLAAIAQILSWSFNFPAPDAEPWLASAGLENLRVLYEGDRPIACLILIPMGQFFGGRRVPMVGVAGVATAADKRGGGAATTMMRAAVSELYASGAAISTLYPATRPLYRRAGYEVAGGRSLVSVRASDVRVKDRGLAVRPAAEADRAAIEALYRDIAADRPGHLDRGGYVWRRVMSPRGQDARGFVVEHNGRIDGYIYMHLKDATVHLHDVVVTDAAARSAASTRRLLGLLSDHAINAREVSFRTGPSDPFVHCLPEVGFEIKSEDQWMLRVVDIKRALGERGYIDGVKAELHLDVTDDLIPENRGRFVLSVEGGRGQVKKGGRGRLSIDARGLAPLFTGHMPPETLVMTGLLSGSPAEIRRAAAVFSGPSPWMPDYF